MKEALRRKALAKMNLMLILSEMSAVVMRILQQILVQQSLRRIALQKMTLIQVPQLVSAAVVRILLQILM